MKWMRGAGYDVNQWAPFTLIGNDVTFDFGKKGNVLLKTSVLLYTPEYRAPGIHRDFPEMLSIQQNVFSVMLSRESDSIFTLHEKRGDWLNGITSISTDLSSTNIFKIKLKNWPFKEVF